MSEKLVTEKIGNIFKKRTGMDINEMESLKDAKLLGSDIRLPARELVLILYDIEKTFNIDIPKQAVLDGKFDSYSHIMEIVLQHVV